MASNLDIGPTGNEVFDKKGTPNGAKAQLNCLPPGPQIQDQTIADIREEPLKVYSGGTSYPGDGG